MNIEYYNELLSQAVNTFILKGVAYLSFIALFCLIGWLLHKRQGLKFEFTTKRILYLIAVVVAVSFGMGLYAIPAAIDRNAEDYVEVHGTYLRYSEGVNYRNFIVYGYVEVTPDGQNDTINLILATKNYTTKYFPLGEHEGTLIYARRSGIALEFIPDP